jgi:aryl-alcohol dehydrogenase-like predicted oxidoreductase
MQYTKLGRSGLTVSRLCLGCMTYGDPARGPHPWTLDEAASRPLIRQALELGINFFDTANAYSAGSSEEILGRALADFANRDEIVVATKAFNPWRDAPNAGGLSRKALFQAVDDSLRRLGMDYVDLLQIHRWDDATPIEETMDALDAIVRSGKARYIGASSMWAWQFHKAQFVAERAGGARFISMQNHLNLLYREEEREMLPLCADQQVGVLPWSPLARGRLSRPWDERTARIDSDVFGAGLYRQTEDNDRAIAEALGAVALARGAPRAQVALAWLLAKPEVTAPIVGASKDRHLADAAAALDLALTADEIAALEAPYLPHPVAGHGGASESVLRVAVRAGSGG